MASFLIIHLPINVFGGAERACHYVIKSLVEHGQEVELLSFEFDRNAYKEMIGENVPHGINVHELLYNFKPRQPFTIYKKYYFVRKSLINFKKKCFRRYDFLFLTHSSNPYELNFLNKIYDKAIGYVQYFPEIHHEYEKSSLEKKIYFLPFKRWVEKSVSNFDLIICNSNYTREMIVQYWSKFYTRNVEVIYPPVDLNIFWCSKPLDERENRVVFVGRFTPEKKHEIMKKLAESFPDLEFISVGLLTDDMKKWFENFRKDVPKNYLLKPNMPKNDLKELLQRSKFYVHLMEGEPFGTAPMEALASGCITLIPENSGAKEFIPEEFRWKDKEDLKNKISKLMKVDENWWNPYRKNLWQKIMELDPTNFSIKLWKCLKEKYPNII